VPSASMSCHTKSSQFVVALGALRTHVRDEVLVETSGGRTTVVRTVGMGLFGKLLAITLASFALVAGGLAWFSSRRTEAASPTIALDSSTEFVTSLTQPGDVQRIAPTREIRQGALRRSRETVEPEPKAPR